MDPSNSTPGGINLAASFGSPIAGGMSAIPVVAPPDAEMPDADPPTGAPPAIDPQPPIDPAMGSPSTQSTNGPSWDAYRALQAQIDALTKAKPAAAPSRSPKTRAKFPSFIAETPTLPANYARHFLEQLNSAIAFDDLDLSAPGTYARFVHLHSKGEVALSWISNYSGFNATSTVDQFTTDFLARFDTEVRSQSERAIDNLFEGKVVMHPGTSISAYLSIFRDAVLHIPDLTEMLKIRWFLKGLTPTMHQLCIIDSSGRDFTSFDALILHATGEERRLRVLQLANPSLRIIDSQPPPPPPRNHRPQAPHFGAQATQRSASETAGFRQTGQKRAHFDDRPHTSDDRDLSKPIFDRITGEPMFSYIRKVDGELLPFHEFLAGRKAGMCFNCFKRGHMAKDCKCPKKPFPDDPPPRQSNK